MKPSAKAVRGHLLFVSCAALAAVCGQAVAQTQAKVGTFKRLADFDECMQKRSEQDTCLKLVKEYAGKHPKEALEAARLVRRNFNSTAALSLYEGVVARQGASVCSDEDLAVAVVAGLALPGDYPDAGRARKIFAEHCRSVLEPAVIKEVSGEKGASYLKDNACPILRKQGKAPDSCSAEPETAAVASAPETLPKVDKKSVKLEPGKAYRGGEGEVLALIPLQGGELFLAHFEGIRGLWNGKTILLQREDRGNGAAIFWTEYNGKRWNSVLLRGGMEVYVPDYKPGAGFGIGYSEQDTKEIKPQAVLDTWVP